MASGGTSVNKQRNWIIALGASLILAMLPFMAGPSYADRNVPPWPSAGPDTRTVPRAPALKPLPPGGLSRSMAPEGLADIISDPALEMKALVLYTSGNADGVFATIQSYLEILGVPYDAIDAGLAAPAGTVEESDLWDGVNRGYYQAIFVTTSDVWATFLDAAERSVIEAYARAFAVRQVTLYAFPNAVEYGLDFEAVAPLPLNGSLTTAGNGVFSYLRSSAALPFHLYDVYGYLGQPAPGADVTTLLQGPTGATLLAVFRPGDGREHMVFTMSSYYPVNPPSNIHARLLPYGMINWALRGTFLGERRLYFAAQPDDVLGWGDCWDPVNHVYIYDTCYRNAPDDLDNLVARVDAMRANVPNAADLHIEMPFNAEEVFAGTPPEFVNGQVVPNTLTAKAVQLGSQFTWLNHTYSHADLDYANAAVCAAEIQQNSSAASTLGFMDFSLATLLTGDYSGLGRTTPQTAPNPNLAGVANALGVRYVLVNESDPLFKNPSPNTGIPHSLQPTLLQVPRYANNIFYAASTPAQEADLYNWIYCLGYAANPNTTTPCYGYETILDMVTNQALGFLLDFSVNPTMFHMNNLDAYDAEGRTLMTDFIEALYAKYNTYYNTNVPVLSLRTQDIGQRMWDRMAYDASGAHGELRCGGEITLHTTSAAPVPVTGVSYGANIETYAGQPISTIPMTAGATVVIPGEPARVAAAISDLSAQRSEDDVLLDWTATSVDTQGDPLSALVYRVYGHPTDANFTPGPETLLGELAAPPFAHLGAGNDSAIYTYLVTTIGDNCWKRESAASNRVTSTPLAVMLASFQATALEDAILVQWETVSEIDNRGFNLYRGVSPAAPDRQLNPHLIPSQSQGSPTGFLYTWEDRVDLVASQTYYYWLEDVAVNGRMTIHGPVNVLFGTPTAVGLAALAAQSPGGAGGGLAVGLLALASLALVARRRRNHL